MTAFSKIGLHVAANCGGCAGIESYWQSLEAAGVPFTVYSANDAGLIVAGSKYSKANLVYRDVVASTVDPADYGRDPATEAYAYWEATKLKLPNSIKELKGRCRIELLNEPGREPRQADWVGWLMYHMAGYAIKEGYRVMGPGWAPGNPEPEAWSSAGWRAYLGLCAEKPDWAAVSLHEYSLDNDIHHLEPWLVGRFRFLLEACAVMGITPPRIWITECGWTLNSMPTDAQAKADIAYLAKLYAGQAEIQAASLWTLQSGAGNGNLPQRLNALISWLTQFSVTARFPEPEPMKPPNAAEPDLPRRHKAIAVLGPQTATPDEWLEMARYSYQYRHTMLLSLDDAKTVIAGGNQDSYVKLAYPAKQPDVAAALTAAGIKWQPILDTGPEPSLSGVRFGHVFAWRYVVTSPFNAPRDYAGGRHEGIDFDIIGGLNNNTVGVLCLLDGVVAKSVDSAGGYGKYVLVEHNQGGLRFFTRYAHLDHRYVEAGAAIRKGEAVGEIGSTGNAAGEHVHINIEVPGRGLSGYVIPDVVDPTPYIPDGASLPLWTSGQTVDLLPYFKGDHRRQFDMGYGDGTQTVQVWHLSDKDWIYIKGENGEYERLGLRTWSGREWLFRFEDTSESESRFYAHYLNRGGAIGAPWMPRYAEVGRRYETSKFVQHYLKVGCVRKEGNEVTDSLRLVSLPRAVIYPQSGARLDNVITVEWSGGEQYDFALGRGCVAFRDRARTFWFIGDLQGRSDRVYRKPGCLDLGW